MSDVKWIKISTSIFDDEIIELIEKMPEGDSLIVIWLKLLTKAGTINDNGLIYLKKNIPYTDEMLATVFRRPVNTVRLALKIFEQFGMIEILDNEGILISNWEKHQSVDKLEKMREQARLRMQKYREKLKDKQQKLSDSNVTVTLPVTSRYDIEEDKEEDKDKEIDKESINLSDNKLSDPQELQKAITKNDAKEFINLYNSIAIRLPKVKTLTTSRENKIKARLKNLEIEKWKTVFEKCEKSDFCCGVNSRNWRVSLDWLIKNDTNYVKVLEGRYDNKKSCNSNLDSMQEEGMEIL